MPVRSASIFLQTIFKFFLHISRGVRTVRTVRECEQTNRNEHQRFHFLRYLLTVLTEIPNSQAIAR